MLVEVNTGVANLEQNRT